MSCQGCHFEVNIHPYVLSRMSLWGWKALAEGALRQFLKVLALFWVIHALPYTASNHGSRPVLGLECFLLSFCLCLDISLAFVLPENRNTKSRLVLILQGKPQVLLCPDWISVVCHRSLNCFAALFLSNSYQLGVRPLISTGFLQFTMDVCCSLFFCTDV